MKKESFRAFAAAILAAMAPALFAQGQDEAASGISADQALELARIVNAAGDDTKEAIGTVVKDVLASAGDANAAAGEISAALAAAVVAQGGKDVAQNLAEIVAAVAATAPADGASALAERAAAAIVAATGIRSFADLVPEGIATAAADAAEDPLSVITAKDARDLRDIFTRIYTILTPDTYTTHGDGDAVFMLGTGSAAVGPGGMATYGKTWTYGPDGSIVLLGQDTDKDEGAGGKPGDNAGRGGKTPSRPTPGPRPSPTPVGNR